MNPGGSLLYVEDVVLGHELPSSSLVLRQISEPSQCITLDYLQPKYLHYMSFVGMLCRQSVFAIEFDFSIYVFGYQNYGFYLSEVNVVSGPNMKITSGSQRS
jgi:hypothetical protein